MDGRAKRSRAVSSWGVRAFTWGKEPQRRRSTARHQDAEGRGGAGVAQIRVAAAHAALLHCIACLLGTIAHFLVRAHTFNDVLSVEFELNFDVLIEPGAAILFLPFAVTAVVTIVAFERQNWKIRSKMSYSLWTTAYSEKKTRRSTDLGSNKPGSVDLIAPSVAWWSRNSSCRTQAIDLKTAGRRGTTPNYEALRKLTATTRSPHCNNDDSATLKLAFIARKLTNTAMMLGSWKHQFASWVVESYFGRWNKRFVDADKVTIGITNIGWIPEESS